MIDAHEIFHGVWVGGWSAARNYGHHFQIIVNCAVDAPHTRGEHFRLVDGPGNETQEFEKAVACVMDAIRSGEKTLVHCVAGRSRSLVVAATAISCCRGIEITTLIETAMGLRKCEGPNQPHQALLEMAQHLVHP
jgi:predicted protein tyrosine phosphatase